jgi:hypothetical protein
MPSVIATTIMPTQKVLFTITLLSQGSVTPLEVDFDG